MKTEEGQILDRAYDHWILAEAVRTGPDQALNLAWFSVNWTQDMNQELWIALKEVGYLEQNEKGEWHITKAGIDRYYQLKREENPEIYQFSVIHKQNRSYLKVTINNLEHLIGIGDDARLTFAGIPGLQPIRFEWLGIEGEINVQPNDTESH